MKEYTCLQCNKTYKRPSNSDPSRKPNWSGKTFCSRACRGVYESLSISKPCGFCGKLVTRPNAEFLSSKSGFLFCNKSCSCSYHNKYRRKTRRSKHEKMLFNLIKHHFPNLKIIPNDKTMLDGLEVDIAIPELNIGIEWNGIVHFRPIYGQDKLNQIQYNDQKKLEIAKQKRINLIVIPDLISKESYVYDAFNQIKKHLSSTGRIRTHILQINSLRHYPLCYSGISFCVTVGTDKITLIYFF